MAAVVGRDARSREMTRMGCEEKKGAHVACSWGGNVYFLLVSGGGVGLGSWLAVEVYKPLCLVYSLVYVCVFVGVYLCAFVRFSVGRM